MKKLAILTACVLALSACATQEKPQVEHHGHHAAGHNHEQGHQMPEFMKDMTPEQRQQYCENMHNAMKDMTPEQRKEFREAMHKNMHGNSGNQAHNHGDGKSGHQCPHHQGETKDKKVDSKDQKTVKKAKKAKKAKK